MNNAEKFKQIFGLRATELWSMPASDFLEWLNRDVETTQIDHTADIGKKVCVDTISRQAAIDVLLNYIHNVDKVIGTGRLSPKDCKDAATSVLAGLPSAQSELTDEQSIAHLQSSGWMQRHDKEMYESGLKEQLADDSDSYDSLLPAVHPEVIRCKNCEHWKNEHLCESLSRFGSFETKADFHCGYAERRTDERTD